MQKFKLNDIAGRYGWDLDQLHYVSTLLKDTKAVYWICGGALRRPIFKEDTFKQSDFDLFFPSQTDLIDIKSILISLHGFTLVRENDSNEQLEKQITWGTETVTVKIQLIKINYYPTIESTIESFDFTLCQLGWNPKTDELFCADTTLFDIANKRLVVNKITYPVASLRRILKYGNQGFRVCQGAMTEFLTQVQMSAKIGTESVIYFD